MSTTLGRLDCIGARIRTLRVERGLSGRDLAKLLDVSPMAVSKWEAGATPSSTNLISLAREFGCTVEFLLGCWRDDVGVLVSCIDHAVGAGIISQSKALELFRAFDLTRAP